MSSNMIRKKLETNICARFNPRAYGRAHPEPPLQSPESIQSLVSDHHFKRQQLDNLENQLQEVRSQRSRTPAHLRSQIEDKDHKIQELQNAVFNLHLTIRDQEEVLRQKDIRINQQAATIQIHSEEIAKSNKRPPKFDAAPIRLPSQTGLSNRYLNQGPPSAYDQCFEPQMEAPARFRTKWGDIPQAGPSPDICSAINRYEDVFDQRRPPVFHNVSRGDGDGANSPVFSDQMGGLSLTHRAESNTHSSYTTPPRGTQSRAGIRDCRLTPVTSHGSGQVPIPPVPPQALDRPESVISKPRSTKEGAVTPYGSDASKQAMSAKVFSDLFDHVVEFAYYYANAPSTQADSNLPQELKQRLMNAATKTTAHKIMSSQNTRYLLVAKIMLLWIQSNIFKEEAFFGLDKAIDDTVAATRKKIFNNTPAPVRFVFLQDIANQFVRLRKTANYVDFVNTMSHKRASELWSVVRPLMYNKVDGDWQSMHKLMKEAHQVAEIQLAEIAEFRLFFPKIHDPFNEASMINMDPEFDHLAPDEVMARRAMVRLGAIPQVMARVTSPEGSIVTKTLIKAGVLLKVGGEQKK